MEIQLADQLDDTLREAVGTLVSELSSSSDPPNDGHLEKILNDSDTHLFVAREEDRILGMLTLALYRIPTGTCARIEDVVVKEGSRGRGLGKRLTRAALERAKTEGAKQVDLTSRPQRKAANHLYQSLGFTRRDTNVYRYRWD